MLSSLSLLGGDGTPAFLYELIDAYLEDCPARIAAIKEALAASDGALLNRAAHTLKGSSGNMGAVALAAQCDALQTAAMAPDFISAAAIAGTVLAEYAAVERELRAIRSGSDFAGGAPHHSPDR